MVDEKPIKIPEVDSNAFNTNSATDYNSYSQSIHLIEIDAELYAEKCYGEEGREKIAHALFSSKDVKKSLTKLDKMKPVSLPVI